MAEKDERKEEPGYTVEDRRSSAASPKPPEDASPPKGGGAPPPRGSSAPPPLTLVSFLQAQYGFALYQLGILPDERGERLKEKRPDLARQAIDLLAILQEKTRGNLTPEEDRLLADVLFDLRLRFVESGPP